ncbi:unnamed protein product [Haemonchus placei]|uniref:CUB domain-containing protein n=1 Tax=Haemonchus placei TaxID=6290 RepID=A0A0N4WFJ6_HAEPC|nr:unnamed protein product [Haemonchus placei]
MKLRIGENDLMKWDCSHQPPQRAQCGCSVPSVAAGSLGIYAFYPYGADSYQFSSFSCSSEDIINQQFFLIIFDIADPRSSICGAVTSHIGESS